MRNSPASVCEAPRLSHSERLQRRVPDSRGPRLSTEFGLAAPPTGPNTERLCPFAMSANTSPEDYWVRGPQVLPDWTIFERRQPVANAQVPCGGSNDTET